MTKAGEEFARALAEKDLDRVAATLDPEVDFRGLTPRRAWEATTSAEVVSVLLTSWFEDSDHIDGLDALQTDDVGDRLRVAYRFRGHNGDGPFVVEQQAYYAERDGRIVWMRVLCSGLRPA